MDELSVRTSISLLEKLRDGDPAAWKDAHRLYGPMILKWCRDMRLQEADAQDLSQKVLLKLFRRMSGFHYDPTKSFRAYLKTLVHYAWCDLVEDWKKSPLGNSEQIDEAAGADLLEQFEKRYDLDIAMTRIRTYVEPKTWEAFQLTAIDGLSGAEVSQRMGLSVASVYKARHRVQNLLKDTLADLQRDGEGSHE